MTERPKIVGRCEKCSREFITMPNDGLDHYGIRLYGTSVYPICEGQVKPVVFGEQTIAEIDPHAYVPSATHQGDCAVCGHLQGSAVHSPFRRT